MAQRADQGGPLNPDLRPGDESTFEAGPAVGVNPVHEITECLCNRDGCRCVQDPRPAYGPSDYCYACVGTNHQGAVA